MSALYPTRSNHSSMSAKSSLFFRTSAIGIWTYSIERPSPAPSCRGGLGHGERVAGEVDLASVEPAGVGEGPRAVHADVRARRSSGARWPACSAPKILSPFRNQGARRFSMKNTGRRITCEGKPERADGLLDAPLVLEVRDAGVAVRRADRTVDEVLDAGSGAPASAMRLPCSSSFSTPASQVFCTANTPQAPASACLSEAASSRSPWTSSRACRCERLAAGAVGLARHGATMLKRAAGELVERWRRPAGRWRR